MAVIRSLERAAEPFPLQVPRALRGIGSLVKRLLFRGSLPASAPDLVQAHSLQPRQGTVAIPTVYYGLNAGPSPGVVVGATLGAVAGFLLLIWLFSTLTNRRGQTNEVEVIRERSPRRRSRRSEMRSVSRSPRERVVRQERIIRDGSRAPPAMPRSSFVVDDRTERRVEGDDMVEVIEEHSSVGPRRPSRRTSGGYRSVEPELYAGGNYPQRPIY